MARKKPVKASELDEVIASFESREQRHAERFAYGDAPKAIETGRIHIGTVEEFFSKINVAAVKLTGKLSVGDIIEIGTEEEAIRQRVSSMQIDRQDVQEADDGDSVGIKTKYRVPIGSGVYRIG